MPRSCTTDERLSSRLVAAIADHNEVDPTELSPPLYESIDLEALDLLFDSTQGGRSRSEGRVTFVHDGLEITIDTEGSVDVTELDENTTHL